MSAPTSIWPSPLESADGSEPKQQPIDVQALTVFTGSGSNGSHVRRNDFQ
jgi:hypothetical protein